MTTTTTRRNEAATQKTIKVFALLMWGVMMVMLPALVIYSDITAGHLLIAAVKTVFASLLASPFFIFGLPAIVRTIKG